MKDVIQAETFQARLLCLMLDRNVTQKEVCESTNITPPAMSKYLNGHRVAAPHVLTKLAAYFNVSVDYLLGATDKRQEDPVQEADTAKTEAIKAQLLERIIENEMEINTLKQAVECTTEQQRLTLSLMKDELEEL